VSPPRVLRPGMIRLESLGAVVGEGISQQSEVESDNRKTLPSPGLLKKHYAPKARLLVLSWRNDADLKSQIANHPSPIANCHIIAHTKIPAGFGAANVSVIPHDAEAFARAIYAELHRCDATGAELIVVEAPPEAPEWAGIADRLRRAAA